MSLTGGGKSALVLMGRVESGQGRAYKPPHQPISERAKAYELSVARGREISSTEPVLHSHQPVPAPSAH